MIDIYYEIYRLQVCAWAYDWSDKELENKIRSRIVDYQLDKYFKREEDIKQSIDNLMFEIKNRDSFDICILKEERNKSYRNKYIKRKYRFFRNKRI